MDKKEFAKKVIGEVRSNVSIVDVASEFLKLKYSSGNYITFCPFHNDKHLGSFSISPVKNIYKCFACGEGGDVIKLYQYLKGYQYYTESAMELALKNGIILKSAYDEYMENDSIQVDFSKKEIKIIDKKFNEEVLEERRDDKTIDFVYRGLRYLCGLSEEHKKYLMEKRYMSEEECKDYFTMPEENIVKKLVQELKKYKKDFTDEDLKGIPGFFYNKKTKEWCNAIIKGIGICITNSSKIIEGIQVRRDKVKKGYSRYIWFSSAFVSRIENFDCGTKSKPSIDVVYPDEIKLPTIFITEGRFKARVIAKTFGVVALSVQGVGNSQYIKEEIEKLQNTKKFKQKYNGVGEATIRHIMIAFDADMAYNVQVSRQAVRMVKNLESLNIEIKFAIWADELGKGIDDMILEGNKKMLDSFEKDEFISAVDRIVEEALGIANVKEIKDIPKELVKELYLKYILSKCKKYKNIY